MKPNATQKPRRRSSSVKAIQPARIAELRIDMFDMDQREFAKHVGIAASAVTRAEQGSNIRKRSAESIALALGEPFAKLFSGGAPLVIPDQKPSPRPEALHLSTRDDIRDFLNRNNNLSLTVIDEFLELHHSPAWRGWLAEEITFEEIGEYEPPNDFQRLMERYKPKFNKSYYSLSGFGPLPTQDDEQDLAVYAKGGSFHHVNALTRIFEEQALHEDCRAFRRFSEESLFPISRSPLYHNINCEVVVVTSDDYIVLCRRRLNTPFFPGVWSASLEEQMLRYDPDPKATIKKDAGLFEAAERGATGELGFTVDAAKPTRLLSVGVEWRNFTAAFVFVIHATEDYATIKDICWSRATDRNEAIAIDCVSASPEVIRAAMSSSEWIPNKSTAKANSMFGEEVIQAAIWHPTSRARLEAYIQHLTTPR